MCGIVYIKRKDNKPAYKSVLKRYRAQASRGQQGFGYVAVKDNKVVSYHRAPTEAEIIKLLEKEDASEILFHHRFPTSTPNIEESAHPIVVDNPKVLKHGYIFVHNGVITNTEELYDKHVEQGFKYNTEIQKGFVTAKGERFFDEFDWNDSESIAIETALALDGVKGDIDTRGAAAVIGFKLDREGNILERIFYRNKNPLKYSSDATMTTLTSEGKGTDVDNVYVFQMNEDGSIERQKKQILTPWCYTYEKTSPALAPHEADDSWGTGKYAGYGYQKHSTPNVPALPGRGFQQLLTPEERAAREASEAQAAAVEAAEDEAFNFSEEDYGLPAQPDYQSIGEMLAFTHAVDYLTEDKLWVEYEKCANLLFDVKSAIEGVDAYVENSDELGEGIMDERMSLSNHLEKLEKHLERLDKALQKIAENKAAAVDAAVARATATPLGF